MSKNFEAQNVFPQIVIARIPKTDNKSTIAVSYKLPYIAEWSSMAVEGYLRCTENCLEGAAQEFCFYVKSQLPFGVDVTHGYIHTEGEDENGNVDVKETNKLSLDSSLVGRMYQRYFADVMSKQRVRLTAGTVPIRINHVRVRVEVSESGKLVLKHVPYGGLVQRWLEVMCVASSNGSQWILPKGGWETFETLEQGCKRETYEEAGCVGYFVSGSTLARATRPLACVRYLVGGVPNECWSYTQFCQNVFQEYPEKCRARRWLTPDEALAGMFRSHNQLAVLEMCKDMRDIMLEQHVYWLLRCAESIGVNNMLGEHVVALTLDESTSTENNHVFSKLHCLAKKSLALRMQHLEASVISTPGTHLMPCDPFILEERVHASGGLVDPPAVLHLGITPLTSSNT